MMYCVVIIFVLLLVCLMYYCFVLVVLTHTSRRFMVCPTVASVGEWVIGPERQGGCIVHVVP